MHQKQIIGKQGEALAKKYLKDKGYKIVDEHYCLKGGEIDLIAKQGEFLVFVEVKTRTSNEFGLPEEAVNYFKQKSLAKAIKYYLWKNKITNKNVRFDVIGIKLNGNKNPEINHFESVELVAALDL